MNNAVISNVIKNLTTTAQLIKSNCKQFVADNTVKANKYCQQNIPAVYVIDLGCPIFVPCVSGFVSLVLCLWSLTCFVYIALLLDVSSEFEKYLNIRKTFQII